MSEPARALSIPVGDRIGAVDGILLLPPEARLLYVLAHGAGAGMRHAFMESIAEALARAGVATLRYQFPFTQSGGRRPDPPSVLEATARAAVAQARTLTGLAVIAGGKSMGGRMTSQAASRRALEGVRGLVFLGFPLHPSKQPGDARAMHLDLVRTPMLFVQGTRDDLASLDLMTNVVARLGERATMHVLEGANHAFALPKKLGRDEREVLDEIARVVARWGLALPSQ